MSGHNKWSKIKRKKTAEDQKRSKIFSQLSKEIKVAVKEGGDDPETNATLRSAIERAREENMPKENMQRAIDRGAGRGETGPLKTALYEAYGPGGGALLVEAQTDNKNRTAQEIKHLLQKYNVELAGAGSVQWMFKDREHPMQVSLDEREKNLFEALFNDLKEHEDVDRVLTNVEGV